MQEMTILQRLEQQVSEMIKNYKNQKDEVEMLQDEIMSLKAQNELKTQEIEKLSDENAKKDLEIETIVTKIESLLS
jgi:hypothetical protein